MRESPFEIKAIPVSQVEEVTSIIMEAAKTEFDPELPKPDHDSIYETLLEVAKQNCLIGYYNNGNICGFLGVTIEQFWMSKENVLKDVMLYVKPEFRSYSAVNRLLSVAEEFAKLNNIPVALSFLTTKDLAKKGKMIMRRGYKPVSWMMFRRF